MLVLVAGTTVCHAQGEHARRAAAELQVLSGDVTKLAELAAGRSEPHLQRGFEDRIRGSLAALDILFRLADQEADREPVSYIKQVKAWSALSDNRHWRDLSVKLSSFEEKFPLQVPSYPESEETHREANNLHHRLCAGCHDAPLQNVERPAYNLYQQARSTSGREFFARMLIGVRGDRVTGIDNPLSDVEIAGLIQLYKSGDR